MANESNHMLRLRSTKALILFINSQPVNMQGENNRPFVPAVEVINGGKYRGTYAVKEIVIAYAAWLSTPFHYEVLRTFIDVGRGEFLPALPEIEDPNLKAMMQQSKQLMEQSRQLQAMLVAIDQATQQAKRAEAKSDQAIVQSDLAISQSDRAEKKADLALESLSYMTIAHYVRLHGLTHQLPSGTLRQAYGRYLRAYCLEQGMPLYKVETDRFTPWAFPVDVIKRTLPGWLARANGQLQVKGASHLFDADF
jgi:KilA-N domain